MVTGRRGSGLAESSAPARSGKAPAARDDAFASSEVYPEHFVSFGSDKGAGRASCGQAEGGGELGAKLQQAGDDGAKSEVALAAEAKDSSIGWWAGYGLREDDVPLGERTLNLTLALGSLRECKHSKSFKLSSAESAVSCH